MEVLAAVIPPVVLVLALAWAVRREDAKLSRRARRYRQLEFEGIEQLRRDDPYPEEAAVPGAYLREPDGRAVDGDRVLRAELGRAREYTLKRGKGAQCLL
jgi:hypothetical protein